MNNIIKKEKKIRALVIMLELLALGLIIYLIALPFYPSLKYKIKTSQDQNIDYKDIDAIKQIIEQTANIDTTNEEAGNTSSGNTGVSETKTSTGNKQIIDKFPNIPNKLIIPKIGVDIPIIEGDDKNYGLDHGAWKLPKSSNPEGNGNMIITGHRFKYLPPSNLTFYLFHKLEEIGRAHV